MSYLDIARQVKKEDGIEKNPHTLIDQTIRKINKEWESGALEWIKLNILQAWGEVLVMEGQFNELALGGNLNGLREALEGYQRLILALVDEYRSIKGKERGI